MRQEFAIYVLFVHAVVKMISHELVTFFGKLVNK